MSNPYPQQQFPTQSYPPPQPQSSGSGCWLGLLIGCLGTAVLGIVLCAGGVWYVGKNAGKLVAGAVRKVIVDVVEESQLEAQEKTEVIAQIDRVVNAYSAGKISNEEVQTLLEDLQDNPVFELMQVYGVEQTYLEPSGLTAEEKQAAKRVLARVFRGMNEEKIDRAEFEEAMPESMQPQDGDKAVAKPAEKISDDDVKTFISNLKKLADEAEIPDEDFQIDISDELKKDIDKVLAGKG